MDQYPWRFFAADLPHATVPTHKNSRWYFQTCVACKKGRDKSKIYGCITWGFSVNGTGLKIAPSKCKYLDPSQDFVDAVDAWNKQCEFVESQIPFEGDLTMPYRAGES